MKNETKKTGQTKKPAVAKQETALGELPEQEVATIPLPRPSNPDFLEIKISDINEFLKRVAPIKQKSILPVLEYIRLSTDGEGHGYLFDTNMEIWCVHEIDLPDSKRAEYLLDRKLLSALVSSTASKAVYIRQKGAEITMTDSLSKGIIINFRRPEEEHYPEFPSRGNADKVVSSLTPELIGYIGIAKKFVNTMSESHLSYVHLSYRDGKTHLVGTDGHIVFYRDFDLEVPSMLLSQDCASIITMYQGCSHYSVENYDFFDFGKTIYGFAKTEFKTPAFELVLKKFSDTQHFSVSKAELLNFVNLSIRVSPLTYTLFDILPDGLEEGMIRLYYNLPQYSILTEKTIPVDANYDLEDRTLNAAQLLILISPVKSERVMFYPCDKLFFIKDDQDPRALYMVMCYSDGDKEAVAQKT